MNCHRCGGLIITKKEVFDPPHLECSSCGREPDVVLVSAIKGGEDDLGRSGDYSRCRSCGRKVAKNAERCSCGSRMPTKQEE